MNRQQKFYKEKAIVRVEVLWKHYNEHGILYLADVERLTGGKYDQVYRTFKTHRLDSPPVHDSNKEKARRKAEKLTAVAQKNGQSYLTIKQAKKVLNLKRNTNVRDEVARIKRHGFDCPDLEKPRTIKQEIEESESFSMNGKINYTDYPSGLLVMKHWQGPGENQVTYLLR